MGENQCEACGHITTGFEQQEWELKRAVLQRLTGRLSEAVALLELHGHGTAYIPEFKAAIDAGRRAWP